MNTEQKPEKKNLMEQLKQRKVQDFSYALSVADNFIKSKQVKTALVVGAETLSRIVDWQDRNTCVLFGDGAGAVILQATEEKNRGIIAAKLSSDGSLNDILKTSGGMQEVNKKKKYF
jgi:3-oxoacyl-[acyl-carrier-protein] synthase-3